MIKAVYFKNIDNSQRYIGVGEVCSIIQCCYFRSKELGYDKVFMEWPLVVFLWNDKGTFEYYVECPKDTIFPITFVPKGSKLARSVDIIGLDKRGVFFEDSDPLIMHNPPSNFPYFEYLNKYFLDHKEYPVIHIEKDKTEPYVLFHIRKTKLTRGQIRNSKDEDFQILIDLVRKYTSYKLYKIGEPCSLDNQFDKVFTYFNDNINELFKIVNNSILFVGNSSGPLTLAYMLDVPTMNMEEGNIVNPEYVKSPRFEPFWKEKGRKYGKTGLDWVNPNRNLIILRDTEINPLRISNFLQTIL